MPTRHRMPVAVHLFLLRENEVLLLRRFNTGFEDGKYSVIAGHADGGETVAEAMLREAREEAGISINLADLDAVGVMHRRSDEERIDFFFAARRWSGEVTNLEPQKCDHLAWFALDDLPPNIIPYVRSALHSFQSGIWFSTFGWNKEAV